MGHMFVVEYTFLKNLNVQDPRGDLLDLEEEDKTFL
jgi:hypothetical protein